MFIKNYHSKALKNVKIKNDIWLSVHRSGSLHCKWELSNWRHLKQIKTKSWNWQELPLL